MVLHELVLDVFDTGTTQKEERCLDTCSSWIYLENDIFAGKGQFPRAPLMRCYADT
jgi:hypothetical protein